MKWLLTVFIVLALASLGSAPAQAQCEPATPDHCYQQYEWTQIPANTQLAAGYGEYLGIGCYPSVYDIDTNAEFITDEMWMLNNTGEWIESGDITGSTTLGPSAVPGYFVAWDFTSGPYAGFWEQDSFQAVPPGVWELNLLWQSVPHESSTWLAYNPGNGVVTVNGFANDYESVGATTGVETTADQNSIIAATTDMSYAEAGPDNASLVWTGPWDVNGTGALAWGWDGDIPAGGVFDMEPIGAPGYSGLYWQNPGCPSSVANVASTRGSRQPAAGEAGASLPPAPSALPQPSAIPPQPAASSTVTLRPLTTGALAADSRGVGAEYGDGSPMAPAAVTGLPEAAVIASLSGSSSTRIGPGAAATVIQETGHFSAAVPAGHAPVSGDVLTIVVDQATGRPVLAGITSGRPPLAAYGRGPLVAIAGA